MIYLHLQSVADVENFGGGDFKHKTSKIRMTSPKLRVIFWPKTEIQTLFFAQNQVVSKKKKKGLHRNWEDLSVENGNFFFWRPPDFGRIKGLNWGGAQKWGAPVHLHTLHIPKATTDI